jgi:hypothetical protein
MTYISDDINGEECLTPSMLLYGHTLQQSPLMLIDPTELNDPSILSKEILTKRQKYLHITLERAWNLWKTQYLLELNANRKGNNCGRHPKEGDIVLIHSETPRLNWQIAKINKLIKGNDENIRLAELNTGNGVLIRAINKLYPLEINDDETLDKQVVSKEVNNEETVKLSEIPQTQDDNSKKRKGRKAAIEASKRIQYQLKE